MAFTLLLLLTTAMAFCTRSSVSGETFVSAFLGLGLGVGGVVGLEIDSKEHVMLLVVEGDIGVGSDEKLISE